MRVGQPRCARLPWRSGVLREHDATTGARETNLRMTRLVIVVALTGISSMVAAGEGGNKCGDQGKDNRANMCPRLVNRVWIESYSKCRKVDDETYEYEHCSGSRKTIRGANLCCVASRNCPGAQYVAECIGK
jgi:hypothetical protein